MTKEAATRIDGLFGNRNGQTDWVVDPLDPVTISKFTSYVRVDEEHIAFYDEAHIFIFRKREPDQHYEEIAGDKALFTKLFEGARIAIGAQMSRGGHAAN